MKKLLYNFLMFAGAMCFIGGGLMGIFSMMGVCAMLWGSAVLDTALGSPPDYSHPAFWFGLLIMVPGMLIGFAGGLFVCQLVQALAESWFKGTATVETMSKLRHWIEGP